jgi:hypothetical protein
VPEDFSAIGFHDFVLACRLISPNVSAWMELQQVARFREHRFDLRFVLPVSFKTKHACVVVEMLRDSETGSDDDTRNGWTFEDI